MSPSVSDVTGPMSAPGGSDPLVALSMDRLVITIDEAAALLGVSRSAAYRAAKLGQLPTRWLGRRCLVPVPAFRQWLGLDVTPSVHDGEMEPEVESGLRLVETGLS